MLHSVSRLRVTVAMLSALLAVGACSSATSSTSVQGPAVLLIVPTIGLTIKETTSFVDIRFRVQNTGLSSAYLNRCGGALTADVEKLEAGLWTKQAGWKTCILAVATGPLLLDVGSSAEGLMNIRATPGQFRLRVYELPSANADLEPTRSFYSDPFTIN
jgi:hypothetical protein